MCACRLNRPRALSRLSDSEVRVEFLLENPPCKEGQPPDILLKSALHAEKRRKIRVFSAKRSTSSLSERAVSFFSTISHASNFGFIRSPDRLLEGLCTSDWGPYQTTTVIFSRARTQFGKSSWQRFSILARKASLWFGSWWVKTSFLTPASRAQSTACS